MGGHQFHDMFPDEEAAENWFIAAGWPEKPSLREEGMVCEPGGTAPMPFRCRPCRRFFSVRTGTIMRNLPPLLLAVPGHDCSEERTATHTAS